MQNGGKKRLGYLALVATSLLWGTTWVASKMGVSEMSAFQLAGMRQAIGGTLLVGFYMLVRKEKLPNKKQFGQLAAMSLLMFVVANTVSTWSLKYITTGLGALVGALYPLNIVLIDKFFFKKKNFNVLTLIGFFLGILGIGIVFYGSFHPLNIWGFILGMAMAVIANISWSVGTVMISHNSININPYYSIGWQMLIASVIITVIGILTQPIIPLRDISIHQWGVILYLVLIGSIFAFTAFIYSMKVLPHAVASLFAYFNPIVAILAASFIFPGEELTMNTLWGSIVTVIGVFLVNYSVKNMDHVIVEAEI